MKKHFGILSVIILLLILVFLSISIEHKSRQKSIERFQEAKSLYNEAIILRDNDSILEAFNKFIESVKVAEVLPEDMSEDEISLLSKAYYNIAHILDRRSMQEQAKHGNKRCLYYQEMINDSITYPMVCTKIASYFNTPEEDDSCLYYLNLVKPYIDTINDVPKFYFLYQHQLSMVYYGREQYDSCFKIQKDLIAFKSRRGRSSVKDSMNIGILMYHSPYKMQAKPYLLSVIDIDIEEKHRGPVVALLENIYELENNTDSVAFCQRFYKPYMENKIESNKLDYNYSKLYNNFIKEQDNKLNIMREQKNTIKRTTTISLAVIIISMVMIIVIRRNNKKLNKQNEYINNIITDNEFTKSIIEGKIKSKNNELKKKEEEIKSYQHEIAELRSRMEDSKDNLKEYCQSEICVKILNEVSELQKKHKDTSALNPLNQEEFLILLQSAKTNLSKFFKNISTKYPSLKKEDLYYLCLIIINLNDKQIASLFGITYEAVRKRKIKILSIFGIDNKESLHKHIIELL